MRDRAELQFCFQCRHSSPLASITWILLLHHPPTSLPLPSLPFMQGGPSACQPCGRGTISPAGATECTVGATHTPESFCTFAAPSSDGNTSAATLFDQSPLTRIHPHRMFGPIFDNPSDSYKQFGALFFLSVCERDKSNATCRDYRGRPLDTYACRVRERGDEGESEGKRRDLWEVCRM